MSDGAGQPGTSRLRIGVSSVRHHARRLGVEYLLGQVYLGPHPKELMLPDRS